MLNKNYRVTYTPSMFCTDLMSHNNWHNWNLYIIIFLLILILINSSDHNLAHVIDCWVSVAYAESSQAQWNATKCYSIVKKPTVMARHLMLAVSLSYQLSRLFVQIWQHGDPTQRVTNGCSYIYIYMIYFALLFFFILVNFSWTVLTSPEMPIHSQEELQFYKPNVNIWSWAVFWVPI